MKQCLYIKIIDQKGGKVLKKGKCIKIHLLNTKMAIYSILYCSFVYFNAVIISELMRPLKFGIVPVASLSCLEQNPWMSPIDSM